MLGSEECAWATVEHDIMLPFSRVRIVRYRSEGSFDLENELKDYRLDLALIPRNRSGGVSFRRHWQPHRFEPVGEMFVLPPGEPVRARGECGHQMSLVAEFDSKALATWFDGDGELDWNEQRLAAALDISSPQLKATLLRLRDEVQAPGFGGDAMCELLAAQAAIDLARVCNGLEAKHASGGLAPWRLRLIDERLADVGAPPSLAELARLCNLSIRQLTRGFRASRERSIGEHIADSRIAQARRLLATEAPIKRIAHDLGFTSPSNFSSAFQRATGESPRVYRQKVARPF